MSSRESPDPFNIQDEVDARRKNLEAQSRREEIKLRAEQERYEQTLKSVDYWSENGLHIDKAQFIDDDTRALLNGFVDSVNKSGRGPINKINVWPRYNPKSGTDAATFMFWRWGKSDTSDQPLPDKTGRIWSVKLHTHLFEDYEHDTIRGYSTLFGDGHLRVGRHTHRVWYAHQTNEEIMEQIESQYHPLRVPEFNFEIVRGEVAFALAKLDVDWSP